MASQPVSSVKRDPQAFLRYVDALRTIAVAHASSGPSLPLPVAFPSAAELGLDAQAGADVGGTPVQLTALTSLESDGVALTQPVAGAQPRILLQETYAQCIARLIAEVEADS